MTQKPNISKKTVDDFITIGKKNSIQFQNSSYFKEIDGHILEDYNIFRDRYYDKIMSYAEDYTMRDEEFQVMKYRPKKLSAKLYDTVDYWYLLLIINKMYSILDFKKKKIKILTWDGLAYIKNVMMKEESDILDNKKKVSEDMDDFNKYNI